MKYYLIVILFAFLFSCSEDEKTPYYVWSEDHFVEVLTEFQISEAIIRLGYHRTDDSLYLNDTLYNAMFRKLNINRADFDSNYNYYLKDPERFTKIYEEVITNLSLRIAELEQKKDEKQKNPIENKSN